MSATPLQQALEWWTRQDEMGGFLTAAGMLFLGWTPKRSCRAPNREDKSPSFSVYRNGQGEWRFKDQATGEQGGLVGFAMLVGMDEKAAAHWLMEKAGTKTAGQPIAFPPRARVETKPCAPEKVPAMPVAAVEAWGEGVDYLLADTARVDKVAAFRGWPVEFSHYLADCAAISMPLYHGERTIAFLVTVPEPGLTVLGGQIVMRDVGFHCRLKPKDGERASWRFVPNEREHKQSIPALPFLIGGSDFDTARLLIITEGQWDCLAFALAAGWLGDGCLWPEGVCVVGIRGASGINTFLRYYGRFWPKDANCLLLPDTDGPGTKWFEDGDSFADRLAHLCRKVAVVGCGEHKDFNDLYCAERVTPEQIAELLTSHGMALQREVTA